MNNLFELLKRYNCIDIHVDIVGIITLSVMGKYDSAEAFEKPLPFSDFVYIDDFPTLMNTLNEFSNSSETRMYTHFRIESEGELHWTYLCCHKTDGNGFDGVLLDVYEYLDCLPSDNVFSEFMQKQENKISVFNGNSASIDEICGRDYLIRIQQPFADIKGVYSAILDENENVIVYSDGETINKNNEFRFLIKEPIKYNFRTGAYWALYSDNKQLLNSQELYLKTLAEGLSRIAHSSVALYNEMENSRAVNKQLGANVEQQMLINNMQSEIMEESRARDALERVIETAGKYLSLDLLAAFVIDEETGKPYLYCSWGDSSLINSFAVYVEVNYEHILTQLGDTENYFSRDDDTKFEKIGIKTFALSKVIDNEGGKGIIFYCSCADERKWNYNDRKIIRNVSHVVSTVIFRCKTESEIEEKNNQLYKLAFYDSMLEIRNRAKLDADLAVYLSRGGSGVAMAVQILNTRFLNEVFGQNYTDKLLKLVAESLTEESGKNNGIVYRYSGSIMMIIIPDCDIDTAQKITQNILERFKLPFYIDNVEQFAESAIGVTAYNDSSSSCEDVYRAATLSLYRANEYGKNTFAFYNQEFLNAKGVAFNLETELRKSIANNMHNFILTFQPAFNTENEIDHFEALLRWKSEEMGFISPKVFMKLMEKVGLDASIDFWVLPKACGFCKKIEEITGKKIRVSINLTTHEMQTGALPARVQSALAEYGLDGSQLIVEVPEAAHVLAYSDTASTLGKIKKFGVKICIDGFGNEYLPLNVLKNSYIDMIKVSSSFVTNSGGEFDDVLLSTTFSLASSRGIKVCVKNIEYRGQYDAAQNSGADILQGGVSAFPMQEEEIINNIMNESLKV